jgi:inner membrane protein
VPSVFSHAIGGATVVACILPRPTAGLVAIGAVLAVLPDLDVVGLAVGWDLDHRFGHRGVSHSLIAAALLAGFATLALRLPSPARRRAAWLVLALATASHGLLDALTNGGRGVAFFAPFSDARYHFPARPIEVSPIGVREFFTARGVEVLVNEAVWLWAPALAALGLAWALRRAGDRGTPAAPGRDR